MNAEKPRWTNAEATRVADFLFGSLSPCVERLAVAGSLRRERPMVGDVEIVYIPKRVLASDPNDLFAKEIELNVTDGIIRQLEEQGHLRRRTNANGSEMFGEKNKLMVHVVSGIPVDLFATDAESWFNYLVCRTGGAETNVAICNAAIARGEKWNPYGPGFTRNNGIKTRMTSEEAVFRYVGLPYLQPKDRA